jgi:hypothetical protein
MRGTGGDDITSWAVTAKDAAGNSVTRSIYGHLVQVTQNDGSTTSDYGRPGFPLSLSYSGSWAVSNYSRYSQGTTDKTSAAGASATVTETIPTGEVSHVGLVMSKGPTRGSFKVYVDGVLKGTVSTYATTSQDRVIVWEHSLPAGTHTVKIVNQATAGHPYIYLDAVLDNWLPTPVRTGRFRRLETASACRERRAAGCPGR